MLRRHSCNPLLTRRDVPDVPPHVVDVTSVFNPGAVRWRERDLLMLRVQTRGRETVLMPAWSDDGVNFEIERRIVEIVGLDGVDATVYHVYDPRLTVIDDVLYMTCAVDIDNACVLSLARSTDAQRFELLFFGTEYESRNGVLFPQIFGDRYLMLERPNRVTVGGGVTTGSEIVLSESRDLRTWRPIGPVMEGRCHYWDELIGSGPPPVMTREGWLHVYHGVARHFAAGIYQAGVVLLDLDDPSKVLARGRNNILEPREMWEMVGQVPNVVFPSGMIVDGMDGEGFAGEESRVRIYYGAADTVIGLAEGTVGELLAAARLE